MAASAYPLRVEGHLEPLSRWLWLVKWFLAIPHYVALAFLWTAYVLLSAIAFFGILFTGRYPRSIFEFNVGVLRWSWRVAYYAYGALGTDRYPPFTLDDDETYPARLAVQYPEHLSRGLVLVKWWLLAIPHYLIVGLFMGGVAFAGRQAWLGGGGLITILVLAAAITLAFTGRYPQQLFDLILGLNRWVLRVAAYAGLMTDEYPPFRLDAGASELASASTMTLPQGEGAPSPPSLPASQSARRGWTGGRVVAVVIGSFLILTALAPAAAGGFGAWLDRTQREDGFVMLGPDRLTTPTYALTTESGEFVVDEAGVPAARSILGTIRIRVRPAVESGPLFVGIGEKADVARYLGGVERSGVVDVAGENAYRTYPGSSPASAPGTQGVWAASRSGTGELTLDWKVSSGSWTAVVMNADGRRGIDVRTEVGASLPSLRWIVVALFALAGAMLVLGVVLVVVPIRRAART